MIKQIIAVVLLSLTVTACSPSNFERYRYPCQDPKNWKTAECNPPVCEASGTCTKDLVKITTDGKTVEGEPNE